LFNTAKTHPYLPAPFPGAKLSGIGIRARRWRDLNVAAGTNPYLPASFPFAKGKAEKTPSPARGGRLGRGLSPQRWSGNATFDDGDLPLAVAHWGRLARWLLGQAVSSNDYRAMSHWPIRPVCGATNTDQRNRSTDCQ